MGEIGETGEKSLVNGGKWEKTKKNWGKILEKVIPNFPHFPPFLLRPSPRKPTPCVPSALKTAIFHVFFWWFITIFPLHIFTHFPPFPHIFPILRNSVLARSW